MSRFLARYLPQLIAQWRSVSFSPAPATTPDSMRAIVAFCHDHYVTLWRRRCPAAFEDAVVHSVAVLADIGPDVQGGAQQVAFDASSVASYFRALIRRRTVL